MNKKNQINDINSINFDNTQFAKYVFSGSVQPKGFYKCCNCGKKIYLDKNDYLPKCTKCNCDKFEMI